jgi:phosphoenolpyruvate mutase
MGALTEHVPKCMVQLSREETIVSRQLRQLAAHGIDEVVMTTGKMSDVLVDYCESLGLPITFHFVQNPVYAETNYIYSIYCARDLLDDDIVLMHGDLVFEDGVLERVLGSETSCMVTSSTAPLPEKDFKAVIEGGMIRAVGIDRFDNALAAQPLYKFEKADWKIWLDEIVSFCEAGTTGCYAENALNEVSHSMELRPLDVREMLCSEVDNVEDLIAMKENLENNAEKSVYMCFSTDIIHSGHIAIIKKAAALGSLIVGVLSDEAVIEYKRFPLLPFEERKSMMENLVGVSKVVEQKTLSYRENLENLKPDYVVHGDDWIEGVQKPIRDEVISVLETYGGELVEYPYSKDDKYAALDKRAQLELSSPDARRGRLKRALAIKGTITAMEAHSGITGLIVEKTKVEENGGFHQFDAMWVSSLCDSTAKGKPDIELVDMTSRFRTIDDIMEVTTKPIIFDGDTGGLPEHFVYTVKTLERMGVSMIIIEDKTGLKKNSLFGTEVKQTQAAIPDFCEKIRAGKRAQRTKEFMICARIESLILEQGMEDALERAFAFVEAGADAIMIHSRKKDPAEIFEFIEKFRAQDKGTPVVVIPTSFNTVYEEEFKERGANIVIYANQLTRTGFPAMQNAAELILKNHRAKECDDICMPIKDIIRLIPADSE